MFAHLFGPDLTAKPGLPALRLSLVVLLAFLLIKPDWVSGNGALATENAANTVVTVSAANFEAPVAPDSIVAIFGNGLATALEVGGTLPLPLTLAGTTVMVRDSLAVNRPAGLFFVSPGQVNCIIPTGTAPGTATVTVTASNAVVSTGTVEIVPAAPGIFTATSDGHGVPAANVIRVLPDLSQVLEPAYEGTPPNFLPRPIDLGPENQQVFLILYLTGLRGTPNTDGNPDNGSAENVRVLAGGIELTPAYAGVAPGYAALDQLNLLIPRSLIGRGLISVAVVALTFGSSNLTDIDIATPPGSQPPSVTSVEGPLNLLARDLLTINGTAFAANPADNLVRIGGVEAGIEAASPTQLQARVQFGTKSGALTVGTAGGQWTSGSTRQVRTSISGLVRDTEDQPIQGAKVTLVANSSFVMTQPEGWFVLPDTPAGQAVAFKVDVPSTDPLPYPSLPFKAQVVSQRDNPYPDTVYLQQASGPEVTIGGSGLSFSRGTSSHSSEAPEVSISVNGVTLTLPDVGLTATFPNGETTGTLILDVLKQSLTPAALPAAIFSSSIAQIYPFGVKLEPGARLTFPNPDGIPANSQARLFKFDVMPGSPTVGTFVDTGKIATVSPDGNTIQTEANAITETSYYFVAVARQLTTIIGRVVDSDGSTPRRGALVRARGQETRTDGNGGFVLRRVPCRDGDQILVNAAFLRPSGRLDHTSKTSPGAKVNGLTVVGDLVLPSATSNRPPLVYARSSIEMYVEQDLQAFVWISDLDAGQTIANATVTGAPFLQFGTTTVEGVYLLRLQPHAGSEGTYILAITATDSTGAQTRREMPLTVKRLPVANAQSLNTSEDVPILVPLTGSDVSNRPLTVKIKSVPKNGMLSIAGNGMSYTPNQNFNGQDSFTFAVDNGLVESLPATISITIAPVNDRPLIVVPGAKTIDVNQPLTFDVSATDVDAGQVITLSATNLPVGAEFAPNGNVGTFRWTPTAGQTGSYSVSFTATDNAVPPLSDTKSVQITVASLGTWRPTSGPDGGTITAFYSSGNLLLAGTDGDGIFRSNDNGTTWLQPTTPPGSGFIRSFVQYQNAILVGTAGGVFLSANGASWAPVNAGLTNANVTSLTNSLGTIFAGTNGGGVFRLNNATGTWSAVNTNLSGQGLSVSALTNIGEVLYAGTGAGVFSSISAQSWSVNPGSPPSRVVSFALRSLPGGTALVAGTLGSGVYQLLPGANWIPLNTNLGNLTVNAVATNGGNLLFAGTSGGGAFRYDFNAQTPAWTAINNGLTNPIVFAILAVPQGTFAGTQEAGVFRSFDNGSSWAPANNGLPRARVTYLLSNGNSLLAGTNGGGVYLSSNNGGAWTGSNTGLTNLVISSLASGGGNLFAGTVGGGVFRSGNGGASWSPANSGLGNGLVQSLAYIGTSLWAGTEVGTVFVSTNNGTSWAQASNGLPGAPVYALFGNAGFGFAGTNGAGIYRTGNNGGSWTQANNGLGSLSVSSFAATATAIFAGTLDGGVYRSSDNGSSWTSVNNGLTSSNIYTLFVSGGRIYAGSKGGGVFISSNGGDSWTPVNQGLTFPLVLSLTGNGASVFAGTDGGGVFILE